MRQNTSTPIINFTNYITERASSFTGREWVFHAVNDWLADPEASRFFLLIGEPGSGKTAIASRLSQFSRGNMFPPDNFAHLSPHFLSAIHFCSASDSLWIDPFAFTNSLATQLANRYPTYLKALQDVRQDQHIQISVTQNVQKVENGQVAGVVINIGAASPEAAFNRIVREPLEALLCEELDKPVVVLVDALDEALCYSGNVNIISLLSRTNKLPSYVRFILTCRQDSRVEGSFLDIEPFVLSEVKYNQRNQEDICQYVQFRLNNDEELVARATKIDTVSISRLVKVISQKAEGNFLYVRFLLDAMAKGRQSLTELEGLPEGLDELYYASLSRVIELGKRDWFSEYAPLLKVLSVAQESLTLTQLQAFTNHTKFAMWQYFSDLQQFIEEVRPQDLQEVQETRYRLCHQSFVDFFHRQSLSGKKMQLRNNFYLPLEECHKRIIDVYEVEGLATIWKDVKTNQGEQEKREYARRHYATHLYLAQEWDRLFAVLDSNSYRLAKTKYDVHSYTQDLNLGRIASARKSLTLLEGIALLPHLWRYTLVHCSLVSQANHYSLEKFEALMLLRREQEALGLAELLADPSSKASAMMLIAYYLRMNRDKAQESLQLFMRVRDIATSIEDSEMRAGILGILSRELTEMHLWEQAADIARNIENNEIKVEWMVGLGQALGQMQRWNQAEVILSEAETLIYEIEDKDSKIERLTELGKAWAYAHQWEQAKRIISTLDDTYSKVDILIDLGNVLRCAQQNELAEDVWTEAEVMIRTIEDLANRTFMLGALSCKLAGALHWVRADALWAEALLAAQNIEDHWDKAEILIELGKSLVEVQHLTRANTTLSEAEAVIRTIEEHGSNYIERAVLLGKLGKALAYAHQWERARSIADEIGGTSINSRTLADLSGKFRVKAEILVEMGKEMAQAGLEEQAKQLWLEALPAGFIEWDEDRKWLLGNLAKVLIRSHQFDRAEIITRLIEDSYDEDTSFKEMILVVHPPSHDKIGTSQKRGVPCQRFYGYEP